MSELDVRGLMQGLYEAASLPAIAGATDLVSIKFGGKENDPEVLRIDLTLEQRLQACVAAFVKDNPSVEIYSEFEETDGDIVYSSISSPSDRYSLYVDPFDGSTLYKHGLPAQYCSAGGLYDASGRPVGAYLRDYWRNRGGIVYPDGAGGLVLEPMDFYPPVLPSGDDHGLALAAFLCHPAFLKANLALVQAIVDSNRFEVLYWNAGPGSVTEVVWGELDVYVSLFAAKTELYSSIPFAVAAGLQVRALGENPFWSDGRVRIDTALDADCVGIFARDAALADEVAELARGRARALF